ncbi:adenylyl-sulfate kinase [Marinilabilia rubra]|uniref:Adenylyl-sulfate kinase n=1 Tax=Marinilabilia rubra TaxID=2162893 RepID=A0A2U2B3B6_9BACT|nr:adenylyl-sulfate kinase [Marinilabilia rubra]PWD97552.1 adenylyl-sulfate kinase [Marinilabilia rubra]
MTTNIHTTFDKIYDRRKKEEFLNQRSKVIWFTGLSGSGKTTLASGLERLLFKKGHFCQVLDGDNIRSGINNNLTFTEDDRRENIRRIAEVCKLYLNSGVITLCAFISPTNEIRDMAREIIGEEDFLEIHVNTPIEICEERDVKGLYAKARQGKIPNFTGISSPFEAPISPFYRIDTSKQEAEKAVEMLFEKVGEEISW